jgi:hypothetical protein
MCGHCDAKIIAQDRPLCFTVQHAAYGHGFFLPAEGWRGTLITCLRWVLLHGDMPAAHFMNINNATTRNVLDIYLFIKCYNTRMI